MDPVSLETALSKLINDPALRKQMGTAGANRAREVCEWKTIYQRYQSLWEELAERRGADPELFGRTIPTLRPDRLDPFATFAGYSTDQINGEHHVSLRSEAGQLSQRRNLAMNKFAQSMQPTTQECAAIIELLQNRGTSTVSEVIAIFSPARRPDIVRGLVWLAKMDAINID